MYDRQVMIKEFWTHQGSLQEDSAESMTKKISSVAEVISDKIVGNMIITKYFCQRTVKLQNV